MLHAAVQSRVSTSRSMLTRPSLSSPFAWIGITFLAAVIGLLLPPGESTIAFGVVAPPPEPFSSRTSPG